MKYYAIDTFFKNPWEQVTAAVWQRYPNPYSRHVLSEDTIQRRVEGPLLFTKRLLIKTNPIPKWGQRFVNVRQVAIMEESVLDRDTKMLITYTRNVGFATTMSTVEKCTYESNWSEKDGEVTHLRRQAWIDSQVRGFGPILQRFGIERYRLNAHNATKGLQYVLNQLFSASSSGKSAGLVSSHSMTDLRTRTLESTKAPM